MTELPKDWPSCKSYDTSRLNYWWQQGALIILFGNAWSIWPQNKWSPCSYSLVVPSAEQQFRHNISSKERRACLKVSANASTGICKAHGKKHNSLQHLVLQDTARSVKMLLFFPSTEMSVRPQCIKLFSMASSVPSARHFRSGFPEKSNSALPKFHKLTVNDFWFFPPLPWPSERGPLLSSKSLQKMEGETGILYTPCAAHCITPRDFTIHVPELIT